ncbi:MAG: Ig-like domain-containing protein [Bacteroidaceae bacterium]|nr:Ig-like domain-containing protein [Bacteroidaceae bacterium]
MNRRLLTLTLAVLTIGLLGSCSKINERIDGLDQRIGSIENEKIDSIQTVSIIPAYSDGSVEAINGILYLDIIVEPSEAVATLTEDNLKVLVNGVKTKAVSMDTVAVTNLKVDAAKGTITARADISSKLPVENGKALTVAVNVKNGLSDYTTKFYPVTLESKFKNVTGVSIEPAEVTLEVGDTLRLVAAITPGDATNKKVTWSSNDATKVTVDNTGKITAVAFGQATITVTTVDGSKTYSCEVKVIEIKTMAEILKTDTGIPESKDDTTPSNAWVNSTDPNCKAFIGTFNGVRLFILMLAGNLDEVRLEENDSFVRTDDNTYKMTAPGYGTFTVNMTEGKFTSLNFQAESGGKYKHLSGIYATPTPAPELPAGALSGVFSVSSTKKVHFSKGNLVATINDSGAPTDWKFATNQFDCLGEDGANKTIGISAGDVDLFGWSTASTTYGISTSTTNIDYSGDFVDWGKAYCEKNSITPDNTWRTLSKDEWTYLFNTRTVNGGTGAGKSYSLNITYGGKMGVVLYPDDYTGSVLSGTVDSLPEGAVFLPAAGYRYGSNVRNVGDYGRYWSSTANGSYYAYYVDVYPVYSDCRYYGFSVRLITESK